MAHAHGSAATEPKSVTGIVNYIGRMEERPRYYARDHSRDNLVLDARAVPIVDARDAGRAPSLNREGFALVQQRSRVRNWREPDDVKETYAPEIVTLLKELTSANEVIVNGNGILRFGERSREAGTLVNSYPARFVHIDVSDPTAKAFAARTLPGGTAALAEKRRYAHFNIWKVLSDPPQDVPLAVCDPASLADGDLVEADAVFDVPGQPEWSFEGLVLRFNPRHRWTYFSAMTQREALVFKTFDSDPDEPHHVPHSAFDDPSCPAGVPPRCSIEMRAVAYFD